MDKYYLVKDGRIELKTFYDEQGLKNLLEAGLLRRTDIVSDCKRQIRADELDFLFPQTECRIAIVGPAGSGKTCLLACVTQSSQLLKNGSIVVPLHRIRTEIVDGLPGIKQVWTKLTQSDGWVETAPTQSVVSVEFYLTGPEVSRNIRTIDYDGSALDQIVTDSTEQTRQLDAWIDNADALLYLIDSADKNFDAQKLHQFLVSTCTSVDLPSSDTKPVAILLTRADLADNTQRRAEIESTLVPFRLATKVFETTVFSPEKTQSDTEETHIYPHGMIEPFLWVVQQRDRIRFEALRARLNDPEDEYQELTRINRLIQAYTHLQHDQTNPLQSRIERRIEQLRNQRHPKNLKQKYRRILIGTLLGTIVIALLCIIGIRHARHTKENSFHFTRQKIETAQSTEDILNARESYRNTLFFDKDSDAELDRLAEEKLHHLRFSEARTQLEAALRQALGFDETKWLYDEFLERFTVKDYPEHTDQIDRYRAQREQMIDEERQGIRFLPVTAFEEKIARIDERLKVFALTDPRRDEFVSDRETIARNWELSDYRPFYEKATNIKTGQALLEAAQQGKQYLETCTIREKYRLIDPFRPAAEQWVRWFETLSQEHLVTLTLRSIEIPRSFFRDPELKSKLSIQLQIGSQKEVTKFTQLDDKQRTADLIRWEPDLSISIENAILSEKNPIRLKLTVTEKWGWLGGAQGICSVSDSPYPYLDFSPPPNGYFLFDVDQQCQITVQTDLTGYSAPELPNPEPSAE